MATTSVRGRIDTGNIASILIRAGIPGIPKVVYYVEYTRKHAAEVAMRVA